MRPVLSRKRIRGALVAFAVFAGLAPALAAAAVQISETGSTLLYPVMNSWMEAYSNTHAGLRLDARPSGSGAGIADAISGAAQIGGSDAYLSDAQIAQQVVNIPLAVSAQELFYNIPELRGRAPLRLSGPVLAAIYGGSIADWSDPKIAAINPGVVLPKHRIIAIRRADSSGDTFLFTHYLALSTPAWSDAAGFGTHVKWPNNPNSIPAVGNAGMIELARNTAYSVAYVGISYSARAKASDLDAAALQNRSGAFVSADPASIQAAVDASVASIPPDGRLSMVFVPGRDAYPIVNIEYAVVRQTQGEPGVAAAMRDFLNWIVSPAGGNDRAMLASFQFLPLPDRVRAVAVRQIDTIKGP